MNSFLKELVLVLIIAVLGFFGGYQTKQPGVVYVDVPIVVVDTTFSAVDSIKIEHLLAAHDTIRNLKIEIKKLKNSQSLQPAIVDTIYLQEPLETSKIETDLLSEDIFYGHLGVEYFPRPLDWFDINFKPAPLPTVTVTKYIDKKPKWYAHPAVLFSVGLTAGMIITK